MAEHNYGGFTPTLPAIDIQFSSPEQFDHFEAAWRHLGRPPALSGDGKTQFNLMSAGTIVEHELRHFHDFLLNRDLLLATWFRRRMFMNVAPAISKLLRSPDYDIIPFPLTDWAGLSSQNRERIRNDLQPLFPPDRNKFWSPKMLRKRLRLNQNKAMPVAVSKAQADEQERIILEVVQADRAALIPLRNGPDATPLDQLRFTPRFALEFSALNTQLQAVFKTYGVKEGFEFAWQLGEEGTVFTRFFFEMLTFFGSRGRYEGFAPEAIDFPKLNLVAFWIMTGCNNDGAKGSAPARLSTLIEAARQDWDDVFPRHMGPLDLLGHFEAKMGVTNHRDALIAAHGELSSHVDAALRLYGSNPNEAKSQLKIVSGFADILECRLDLINRVIEDPEQYFDPGKWMLDLNAWPQCPVHLRFVRMGIHRDQFTNFPPEAIYNSFTHLDEDRAKLWVGDVYIESFFSGTTHVPLSPVVELQHQLRLFDTLVEPEQVSALDETLIRQFVRDHYGKELVRVV